MRYLLIALLLVSLICTAQANSIVERAEYRPSSDLVLGAYAEGNGFVIASPFQLNLVYQDGIDPADIEALNDYAYPSNLNFPDCEYYFLRIDPSGYLPIGIWPGSNPQAYADDSEEEWVQWTLSGWWSGKFHTIFAGDIVDGVLRVSPAIGYRTFPGDVNSVEVFGGDTIKCEVAGYSFTGEIGPGSILGIELANRLSLDPTPASIFIKPGGTIVVDMNIANLTQMVAGCQAILGYNSDLLDAGSVAAGGDIWDTLIHESWAVAGEINTAIGVYGQSSLGTQEDGKVAVITLTAKSDQEGVTQMIFLPDVSDVKDTHLADMNGNSVWPAKIDSTYIYIDGTPPIITCPVDYSTSMATQTIVAAASDPISSGVSSGMDTFTMNGSDFVDSVTVVLEPGVNTFDFEAIDMSGNVSTKTLTITYNQPAPAMTFTASIAPNATSGSPSWPIWIDNAMTGLRDEVASRGTGYAKYEALPAGKYDYATFIVTPFESWMGLVQPGIGEYGNRMHILHRIDNGVRDNPGAAKLDTRCVDIVLSEAYRDSEDGELYPAAYATFNLAAAKGEFSSSVANMKGYDWDGSAWVQVNSGYLADVIVYTNGYGWDPQITEPTNQAKIDTLYKNLSGAVPYPPALGGGRYGVVFAKAQDSYTGVLGTVTGSHTVEFESKDTTKPVIDITAPVNGLKTNSASCTIEGTATDNETLASGIREVKITLNGDEVYSNVSEDNVSFSEAVTLVEGDNTIVVTAKDFAGNTESKTVSVLLDTSDPIVTIGALSGNQAGSGNFIQGDLTFTVDVDADVAGLASLEVKVDGNVISPVGGVYTFPITSSTANGTHTIVATTVDNAGNIGTDTKTFQVNKNQISGVITSDFIGTGTRTVTFVLDGSTVVTAQVDNTGVYTLTDVADGVTAVSAKTAWTLRQKLSEFSAVDGQITANFFLRGGDLDNSNSVNINDYALLKKDWNTANAAGDIDGSGTVGVPDYNIMKANWFQIGDTL